MQRLNYLLITLFILSINIASAVQFNVSVPAGTTQCFVAGGFQGWSAGSAVQMEPNGANKFTLDLPEVTVAQLADGFKYLCGQDWKYVEKSASGAEINNRTVATSLDVVGSWAAEFVPANPLIHTKTLSFNFPDGIKSRKIQILIPDEYEANPTKSYPIIYLHGIQQFYKNSGTDGDNVKDDFFGAHSWDIVNTMATAQAAGMEPTIVVGLYGLINELSPYFNGEFMGSGKADAYLNVFVNQIMPYIQQQYRVKTGKEHTAIAGADMGGLFSFYAALQHQDKFNKVGLFSPSFWFNQAELAIYIDGWTKTNADMQILFSVGGKEGPEFQDNILTVRQQMLAKGFDETHLPYLHDANGVHRDETWKNRFANFTEFIQLIICTLPPQSAPQKAQKADMNLVLMSGTTETNLVCNASEALQKIAYYSNGTTSKPAYNYVKVIPASEKSKFYWNLNMSTDCLGNPFFPSPKNVSFSSSKQFDSWLRINVYEDYTSDNIAASSQFFRVIKGDNTEVMMTQTGASADYTVKATVDFRDEERGFQIYFGSVNTGTKMTALTSTIQVSETCSKAEIVYSFKTNKVDVNELEQNFDPNAPDKPFGPRVTSFTAIPSVCKVGTPVAVRVSSEELAGYTVSFQLARTYATPTAQNHTVDAKGDYVFTFSPQSGIYEIIFKAVKGSDIITESIWVKVPYETTHENIETTLVTNAYTEINWETTQRHKSNYHTHTDASFDCVIKPNEVINYYREKNYTILALTDHDDNTYPWSMFNTFNSSWTNVDAASVGFLAFPSIELSKDNRNNWSESTGGEFNHHNDFFTGRKGQEFASLQESYAYTERLGGLQIINHPGQYWSLDKTYDNANFEKNSPAWHARNFQTYESLIGLEVYNQGNRRPNDRILWDQILNITMPERPVYGYSCDDAHTLDQYFRNYQFMLMEDLTIPALKDAMRKGKLYFSYEPGGSGAAKAPRIHKIETDKEAKTITIDTDTEEVYWISSTDVNGGVASTRKSTVVGYGKTFYYDGYQGNYVRAMIKNKYGETCTQPFGFADKNYSAVADVQKKEQLHIYPNPSSDVLSIHADMEMESISIINLSGQVVKSYPSIKTTAFEANVRDLAAGVYILQVISDNRSIQARVAVR